MRRAADRKTVQNLWWAAGAVLMSLSAIIVVLDAQLPRRAELRGAMSHRAVLRTESRVAHATSNHVYQSPVHLLAEQDPERLAALVGLTRRCLRPRQADDSE